MEMQSHKSSPDKKWSAKDIAFAAAWHLAWCKRKMEEGYVGPSKAPYNSDRIRQIPEGKRFHPALIPYSDLPDGEKEKRLWLADMTPSVLKEGEKIYRAALAGARKRTGQK